MKYLFLILSIVIFGGCSPKYKVIYNYTQPGDQSGKECVKTCKEKLATCKAICKSNFDICKVKAHKIAKKIYEEKLQDYSNALERYANEVEMYNLEQNLYYFNNYNDRPFFYWRPAGPYWIWGPTGGIYSLQKPVKPSLAAEIQEAEMRYCPIDCKCQDSYNECFSECGGKVEVKRICIENCPK